MVEIKIKINLMVDEEKALLENEEVLKRLNHIKNTDTE